MTIGSLFSGIGGLELGLEMCGLGPVAWQAESDPFARAVLTKHWPTVHRYTDVREINHEAPPVDIICGGFPCQDISEAGKRAGIDGERSGLWREFARIIREVRPRVVFVENVAALLGRGLDRVLGDLAALGFDAEWETFRASDVGAPHLRDRVFVLAYNSSVGRGPWRAGRFDPGSARESECALLAHAIGNAGRLQPGRGFVGRSDSSVAGDDRAQLADANLEAGRREARISVPDNGPAPAGLGTPKPGRLGRGPLADAAGARRDDTEDTGAGRGDARARAEAEGRRTSGCAQSERDGDVADPDRDGRQCLGREERDREEAGQQDARGNVAHGRYAAHRFPPGPAGIAGWDGAQPAVRRGDDGVPGGLDQPRLGPGSRGISGGRHRANRLRVLGNAVVPHQAALAWRTLLARATARARERAA